MNWRRGRNNSPPGTGGVARSAGVVDGSNNSPPHSFIGIKENHFDSTTTPALRATPPVPGGELFLPLLQFSHTFCYRACKGDEDVLFAFGCRCWCLAGPVRRIFQIAA